MIYNSVPRRQKKGESMASLDESWYKEIQKRLKDPNLSDEERKDLEMALEAYDLEEWHEELKE
jgi:hypothetical protein